MISAYLVLTGRWRVPGPEYVVSAVVAGIEAALEITLIMELLL